MHTQPEKRGKGWFVAYWAQRTRFGQRRHGCCEECEEFMTGHLPTAGNVCQRQVSVNQVSRSVRSSREVWTHQLTFIWVSSWFRSREMRRAYVRGGGQIGEPFRVDESVPAPSTSCCSLLKSSSSFPEFTVQVRQTETWSDAYSFISWVRGSRPVLLLTCAWIIKIFA